MLNHCHLNGRALTGFPVESVIGKGNDTKRQKHCKGQGECQKFFHFAFLNLQAKN